MKTFEQLVQNALTEVGELFPWDLLPMLEQAQPPLIIDVREQHEYDFCHIRNSIFVPRGILEQACDWNYDVTIPELVQSRDRKVVVVCRSGTRSVLAALTMKWMGYQDAVSLKTGIRGWNDYDQPLVNIHGEEVDPDEADDFMANRVTDEQLDPARK